MNFKKVFWGLRSLKYKFTFKKFGKLSYIWKPMVILGSKKIIVEDKVRIYPGLRIEVIGEGKIIIKENISIGQNFHITSEGNLLIGKNTTILGNVFITNIDHNYTEYGKHILKQEHIIKETRIGENCFIGYGASIQAGTILGDNCIVGTNAVVRGCFPDGSVIVGVPGKIIKMYNKRSKKWEKFDGKVN